ncbi:unnamed protein product [Clonostachys byssicola]|uniref:Uncharacterized protein n=1 Tax=Clonostachys byssicola TaxID=160290 RepID=A0A9N9UCH4_9HYPO|nr:unnamed protein product [Clonostachys byssicola]
MRYEDWDIVLVPRDSKAPLKEFNVCCHVVPDPEFSHAQGRFGLPTLCCFVPSLEFGTPFNISIHSWDRPPVSQFTRSYSKYIDKVIFEARLFIDGQLVASTSFGRLANWPHAISNIFNFSKNGDLEALTFPKFQREFLQQNRWHPGDNIGRIKLVLSEGFPRDSPSMPIERVKNIVAFSFLHAPLDILENSGIAWPNSLMWRQSHFTSSMPVPTYASENLEVHTHSPRRNAPSNSEQLASNLAVIRSLMSENCPSIRQTTNFDNRSPSSAMFYGAQGYINNEYSLEWPSMTESVMANPDSQPLNDQASRALRKSKTDTSMTDYIPITGSDCQFSCSSDQTHNSQSEFQEVSASINQNNNATSGEIIGYCANGNLQHSLTLTCSTVSPFIPGSMPSMASQDKAIPPGLAASFTNSLLNQPIPHSQGQPNTGSAPSNIVKSRKEACLQRQLQPSPTSSKSIPSKLQTDIRKVSQQIHMPANGDSPCLINSSKLCQEDQNLRPQNISGADQYCPESELRTIIPGLGSITLRDISGNSEKGTKRVRSYTPASIKAIDKEDEARRSSSHTKLTPFVEEGTES